MESRTGECEMFEFGAELAGVDFELVGDVFDFISEQTVQFVVHVRHAKDLDEFLVRQHEDHRELQRFDLVEGTFFRDEVQTGEVGTVSVLDFYQVCDFLVEAAA